MSLLVAQIVSMLALGLATWILGILPIIGVRRGWRGFQSLEQTPCRQLLYSLLLCFGGGVILTSCLTHMLPDVREIYTLAIEEGSFPDSGMEVPEILVLAGFLMIYLLEEVAHDIMEKCGIITSDDKQGEVNHGLERDKELKEKEKEKDGEMGGNGHGHGGGHGHSHEFDFVNDPSESIQATARGFLVILALCIHDLFEGIALGVTRSETAVWFLLLAFASHKWVIGACLGLKWAKSPMKPWISVLYMSTFCGVSPIGVIVGMLLTSPSQEEGMMNGPLIVLQGIATGSLMYVVFFEILEKERAKHVSGILQALAFSGGYIFMMLLGLAEVQSQAETVGGPNSTAPLFNHTDAFI